MSSPLFDKYSFEQDYKSVLVLTVLMYDLLSKSGGPGMLSPQLARENLEGTSCHPNTIDFLIPCNFFHLQLSPQCSPGNCVPICLMCYKSYHLCPY